MRGPDLRWPFIAAILALAAGCTCDDPAPAPPPQQSTRDQQASAPPHEDAWPTADLPDLPPATPATEVTVRPGRITVDNQALVATWPRHALERARAGAPPGSSDWPRMSSHLVAPSVDDRQIPTLRDALESARRAERAATGAGSGAGVYNLRVEASVPFERVEQVLYTAGLVGYGAPRILLAAEGAERMMAWPRAPSAGALAAAEIEAALASARETARGRDEAVTAGARRAPRAPADDEAVAAETMRAPQAPTKDEAGTVTEETGPAARLVVTDERVQAHLGGALQAPGCDEDAQDQQALTMTGEATPEAIARCLERLRERSDGRALTLEVARTLQFGRVAAVLQRARAFDAVRLVGR